MANTKDSFRRYVIIDRMLSDKYHDYTYDDITEEVNNELSEINPKGSNVGRRTIEKDIEFLISEYCNVVSLDKSRKPVFNKELQKTTSRTFVRYDRDDFSIFKQEMTDDEKYLLSEVISLLGHFDGLPNFEQLQMLQAGLSISKKRKSNAISLTQSPIKKSNIFGKLYDAITHHQVVKLQHHTFAEKDQEKITIIHPYLLKEYNRRWFLIALADDTDKIMTYALDRIDSAEALKERRQKPCEADLYARYNEIIGVTFIEENPIEDIIFWVSDRSKDYVLTKPLHKSQVVLYDREAEFQQAHPTLQSGLFFSIRCRENYELLRELTSFGKELIVLSPTSIQEKIKQQINGMKESYAGL